MIRIRLSSEDVARVRIASTPDFGLELMVGGALATDGDRLAAPRLSRWQEEVRRRQAPDVLAAVTGLYTACSLPGLLGRPGRLNTADVVDYLEHIAREGRQFTRFHRALVEGHEPAHERLNAAVADFRATAIEPYRRRISSAVARTATRATAHAAALGIGAALSTIHPKIRWNGSLLTLDTLSDMDFELADRTLVLRPLTLVSGVVLVDDSDPAVVTIGYPTPFALTTPDAALRAPSPALAALLGSSRAAALATVAWSPAITTNDLADSLGLSPATASRHATVLRGAGLIDTVRDGQAVRHRLTRLGRDLIMDSDHA
ncbi:helix-turn-helix domain-containing protein [Catenulispora subtropica]|uniref:Winged helix-turn-helix domain-containing protein n=1 Tax=Catenulispora subtropica TaxID=450798 RepID=A0ABN2T3R1_9ACTN